MARKFLFKGRTLEELQQMSIADIMKLLSSKNRRSLKRMGEKLRKFIERMRAAKKSGKTVKTHAREMPVVPEMVGMVVKVHNGKEWVEIHVGEEMLGCRLGEFSHTTKLVKHSGPGVGATRGSKSVELK
jgi:small subunit ribosomal protein S19